ncbi:MAG: cyanophycin synthetase [Marinilabilia sp.]
MRIIEMRALRGPNYWSTWRHFLIVMTVDLEEMDHYPSDTINGFAERLGNLIPSLYEHRCSRGYEGGFLERLKEGTWMGHIMEHIALEIQILAGMQSGFGRTRGDGKEGVYNVVFSYELEKAGMYAGNAAFAIVEAMIANKPYNIEHDIQNLRQIREEERFGPSTASIIDEAKRRNIPILRLNEYSLVQLGWGVHQQRIQATMTGKTSSIGLEIASDKEETKKILYNNAAPVPYGLVIESPEEIESAVFKVGFPVVIKPLDAHQGKGATIKITNQEDALRAFETAREHSTRVIIEKYIQGNDYRLLIINNKFVAAARRIPAHVIGNGHSTINELIQEINKDPRRGFGHEKMLTEIKVDAMTRRLMEQANYTPDTVLPDGKIFYLKTTANLSTGGISEDVTDTVHPTNIFIAERASKFIDLDICGIDVVTPNLTDPINDNGGAIIEVNGAPGFRMHLSPTKGQPREVAKPVIDMLFPGGDSGRIPIISVTGTNGKTTTTRLIAHIMKMNGKKVGTTTTDGIYIQNNLMYKGDCSGPESARFVLRDPTVDYAVFETARGGMLRAGLGYDLSNVGVVTNVASDHLGLQGIQTMEQMTRLKSIVAENIYEEGYAVLNADDDNVYSMMKNIPCKAALFSMISTNPRIRDHCAAGGTAAVYDDGAIILRKGGWSVPVEKVINIPLTYSGMAAFQIQNVLAACLAAFVQEVKVEEIRNSLQTFVPSPTQLPGRMNVFSFEKYKVIIDYAHNPAGMEAMGKFVASLGSDHSIAIIAGTGDRRDEDLKDYSRVAGEYFDELIIWEDQSASRGRDSREIMELIVEGAKIKPGNTFQVILDEDEAVDHALEKAPHNSVICIFTGRIEEMTAKIIANKEKEINLEITRDDIPNIGSMDESQ